MHLASHSCSSEQDFMGIQAYHILAAVQDKADKIYQDHCQAINYKRCRDWASFQEHTNLCQYEDNCFPEFDHRCARKEQVAIEQANQMECDYDTDFSEELIGQAYTSPPRRGSRELPWSVPESPLLTRSQARRALEEWTRND